MTVSVDSDDLATFLGVDSVDAARAAMLISQTVALAQSVVSPLPDGSEAVILSAVARTYVNPTQSTSQTAGSFNVSVPYPGMYLNRNERRTLRGLAGQGGGAFSIDLTPAGAMADYVDPLTENLEEAEQEFLNEPWGW